MINRFFKYFHQRACEHNYYEYGFRDHSLFFISKAWICVKCGYQNDLMSKVLTESVNEKFGKLYGNWK